VDGVRWLGLVGVASVESVGGGENWKSLHDVDSAGSVDDDNG
jgi:hypothetical protein